MAQTYSPEDRTVLAALASQQTLGPRSLAHVIALGRPLREVWGASSATLAALHLDKRVIAAIRAARSGPSPETVLDDLKARGIQFVTQFDPTYPPLLAQIAVPPAVLFIRGALQDSLAVAVVGTRKATTYGRQVTETVTGQLASHGVTIVSGLALGIDGWAHRAALAAGGTTYAVLACGVDRPYPASHRGLAEEIIERGGALVSEFPPGTEALRHHFPIRNRIIAGMCRATLVTEAAVKSGSLLTARSALEANRDVYAVPGSIFSPLSAGPHFLIQQGAKLVHTAADVLIELGIAQERSEAETREVLPDSAEERHVLEHLSQEPIDFDALVAATELPAATLMSTLTLMEMKGRARNLGGNVFARR